MGKQMELAYMGHLGRHGQVVQKGLATMLHDYDSPGLTFSRTIFPIAAKKKSNGGIN